MNTEKLRKAIAKACGWDKFGYTAYCEHGTTNWHFPVDILSSLDAMHEAEKGLTDEQYTRFGGLLLRSYTEYPKRAISATAAQRAEAFARTLNLDIE